MAETRVADAERLERILEDLADQVARHRVDGVPLALVGVRTRGVPLARRLAERLRLEHDLEPLVGAVDITLYRDDLDRARRWPVLRGTDIPFAVDDAEVVLVDDVLFTGRSARAALNTVCDLGRPVCVRLAVVVDRGSRELPIQADYVGLTTQASPTDRIVVRVRPVDPVDEIVRVARAGK
jgi:pyrimidine operon attenuation protein/uracil phosphoribosyltransferase